MPALCVTSSPAASPRVTLPVAPKVVKLPVLADVLPIGPGVAKRAVKPAPETVLYAASVVNAPVLGVAAPIVVPSIVPPLISTSLETIVPLM